MIVIICGMHRSGTSALAGMLHANGICMGREKDFYPPPMKENPKGFYENVKFRRINDAILHKVGYKVKSFNPDIPEVPVIEDLEIRAKMISLIASYQREYENWGWKDPRTSLTFLSWVDVLNEMNLFKSSTSCLFTLRSAKDISTSMITRGNKEKSLKQFEKLSLVYAVRLLESLQVLGDSFPVMSIAFEDLISNAKQEAERITSFLAYDIKDTSFIDPAIARTVA